MDFVTPDMLPLSDNFYGWAKASYELLGFMFACGKEGPVLENVQLRVGGPRETDIDSCGNDLQQMHRGLGAYLSVRDQVQLVIKSIETEDIRDANGVPFQIFYGISGKRTQLLELGQCPARNRLRTSRRQPSVLCRQNRGDYAGGARGVESQLPPTKHLPPDQPNPQPNRQMIQRYQEPASEPPMG